MSWSKPAWLKESKHEEVAKESRGGCRGGDQDGRGEGTGGSGAPPARQPGVPVRPPRELPIQGLVVGGEPPIGLVHAEAPEGSTALARPNGFRFDARGRRINTWTAPDLTHREARALALILDDATFRPIVEPPRASTTKPRIPPPRRKTQTQAVSLWD